MPTRAEIVAAVDRRIRDVVAPNLKLLFCGINPGLYSAAVGHNFARPGNRFWPTLHLAGFTPTRLSPFDERELLKHGVGITNIVARASAAADELTEAELHAGALALTRRIRRWRPAVVAFLGVTSYRTAFQRPGAKLGKQTERIGDANIWVLPNPSGLNAHFQLPMLVELFAELRRAVFTTETQRHREEKTEPER